LYILAPITSNLFCERTPIESYAIGTCQVFVKRDDLYGLPPAPPLGKLRGLRLLVDRLSNEGAHLLGYFDSQISQIGQGLAAICSEIASLNCIVSYPAKNGRNPPEWVKVAAGLNAEILPVAGVRLATGLAYAKKLVLARGGVMLPLGIVCPEAVQGVADEASTTPPEVIEDGTLVLSCGSGVTLAGVLKGLPVQPRSVVGVCSQKSIKSVSSCLKRYLGKVPTQVELHPASIPYSAAARYTCPFPANPYYDLKAWKHLENNLHRLRSPLLFWNIGA
jgi:1-aminocyclopropane-1-carboxylate deaminase/D-cysteine desulfhydrase-like pyridoxal-dependent ACC family enzyme